MQLVRFVSLFTVAGSSFCSVIQFILCLSRAVLILCHLRVSLSHQVFRLQFCSQFPCMSGRVNQLWRFLFMLWLLGIVKTKFYLIQFIRGGPRLSSVFLCCHGVASQFCFKLGKTAAKTCTVLESVYEDKTLSRMHIIELFVVLRGSRKS